MCFLFGPIFSHKKRLWTFGDDDFDDMAITAGYGNTKFVDDAQVVRLLDSFCYWLLLFFVVVVFEREEDSQIIYRENGIQFIPRLQFDALEERRRPFLEDDTPPNRARGWRRFRRDLFLSLSLVDDDDRKITTTSLFFFFFSRYSYHKNRSRKRRND